MEEAMLVVKAQVCQSDALGLTHRVDSYCWHLQGRDHLLPYYEVVREGPPPASGGAGLEAPISSTAVRDGLLDSERTGKSNPLGPARADRYARESAQRNYSQEAVSSSSAIASSGSDLHPSKPPAISVTVAESDSQSEPVRSRLPEVRQRKPHHD
jgi:hypothetical protein